MGLDVAAMHSDLEQAQREEVMLNFKNNKVKILVATDIVARGIDIEDIGLVLNYDVPHDPEDYIHRIGRTARAAASGAAMTFVSEEEHLQTLSLMREVGYDFAYMFKYSERPGTFAEKHLGDDVPEEVKSRRLSEIIALQNELGHASNLRDVGREFEVLVEGESKRDRNQLSGRTSQNKVVVFDRGYHRVGDYVRVRITGCTPATLFGDVISGPCN